LLFGNLGDDRALPASIESSDLDAAAAKLWALNRENRWDEALALARDLVARYPDEPRAWFENGGALDFQGREAEAVAPYRRAQELGLDGDDLPRL
jgi:Flp pilus assembly protein TadD